MKNNEFRTPLIQSGALLVAIIFIISLVPSGDSMSVGSIIGAFFTGLFKLLLFVVALGLGLAVSIAVLIGVFIAAVALQSPEKAAEIYAETKYRIAGLFQGSLPSRSISTESADTGISQEEYDQMKTEVFSLQTKNTRLQGDVSTLNSKNAQLQDDIHGLTKMVNELKESEAKINELITELSAKVEEDQNAELKDQIKKLEEMYSKTNEGIEDLAGRLEFLEEAATQPDSEEPQVAGGIFAYIESDEDHAAFTKAVEQGVGKELTYAQFDEFFTETLSAELDQIIKDHPSLTKDYIRTMRK